MSAIENIEINDFDKKIYNQYLISSRSSQNKPFKLRQQFDTLSDDKKLCCKKISYKLQSYPFINIKDFFIAPFKVMPDQHIPFEFFSTPKAITAYTKYMQQLDQLSPDEPEMLMRIRDSLLFLDSFCKKEKIKLEEYFNFKINNQYACLMHLKERKTWLYSLLYFSEFDKAVNNCDKDVVRLMYGDDIFDRIDFARARFYNSKCKNIIEKIIKKLKIV